MNPAILRLPDVRLEAHPCPKCGESAYVARSGTFAARVDIAADGPVLELVPHVCAPAPPPRREPRRNPRALATWGPQWSGRD